MSQHLAQINIGRLVAPVGHPLVAEFVALLEPINRLAEQSPGFVWRLQSDAGNATSIPYDDDPLMIVNMSVWECVAALRDYVYKISHTGVLRDRRKWFKPLGRPHSCLWWIPIGHIPTVAEGRQRLEHFERYGPSPEVFWFTDAPASPVAL